jgi:hypothetical protein
MEKNKPHVGLRTVLRFLNWSLSSTRQKLLPRTLGSLAAIACLTATLPAKAGQASWDLNQAEQIANFLLNGNNADSGTWLRDPDGNGFIRVTAAQTGRGAAILFPDFDEGLVVSAFDFSVDVRLGDGTDTPADGFSINYARSDDPAVASIIGGGTGVWAGTTDIGGTETSLPEEGTRTGLAIGFDTWGAPGGGNAPNNADLRGISIRVDGVLIHQEGLPTVGANVSPEDPTSLVTGPHSSADNRGSGENLTWQPLTVSLKQDGKLTVTWKGATVLEDFETGFFPSPGRLVFGGRTGDAYAIQDIDNISIATIPATTFLPSGLSGNASGFTALVNDAQGSTLDPSSIELYLSIEGGEEQAVNFTVSKAGAVSSIRHNTSPNFLPPGSVNTVRLVARDNNGIPAEFTRTFTVRRYVVLQPEWKAPAGSWNPATPGYEGYLHQLPIARGPGDGNNVWNAERHISGGYIDPATGQPYASVAYVAPLSSGGVNADGTFTVPMYPGDDVFINWNQDVFATPPTEAGSFTSLTGGGYPDAPIPGIPGVGPVDSNTDWIAMEAYSYVELQGGKLYTMIVNSDDGFRVTAGPEIRSVLTTNWLGQFSGGKGSSDVQFDVIPLETGVYRFRLAWWEGTGGANLEFFHLLDDGTKVMFNDPHNAQAAKSYRPSATPQPFAPALVSVAPWPGQGGILASGQVQLIFRNGTTATVQGANVEVRANGRLLDKTVATTGDRVRITARPSDGALDPGANTLVINWSDSTGATYEDSYTFSVTPYQTLPEWLARPIGSGTNPGMTARVHQLDIGDVERPNRWHIADQQLEGLFGANVGTQSGNINLDYVNMEQAAVQTSGFFNEAGGYSVALIPGIPGNTTVAGRNTDNIAMDVVTYIEIPQPGNYLMGVASDDGFRVIAGETWSRLPFRVESPASIAGYLGAVSAGPESYDAGNTDAKAAALPTTPIVAELVLTDPPLADAPLNNAAALSGKIALIERGVIAFNDKITRAREAGAIGIVMINSEGAEATNPLPIAMGGIAGQNTSLPAVMIRKSAGDAIRAALAQGPVTASLGIDATPSLGVFNQGRGHEQTAFMFRVTKAGVYPFRLTWFEGGGGASVEWYMINLADGNVRALVNHPNNVELGLKAFRNAPAVVQPTEIEFAQPTFANGQLTLTWSGSGTLQEATAITGPWTAVNPQPAGATITVPTTGDGKFYRILGQ